MMNDKGMIAVTDDRSRCVTYFEPLKEWRLQKIPWTCSLFGKPFYIQEETTQIEQVVAQWILKYDMKTLQELPTIEEALSLTNKH